MGKFSRETTLLNSFRLPSDNESILKGTNLPLGNGFTLMEQISFQSRLFSEEIFLQKSN